MKYDVAIIGGGPAGYTAAERAAQGGLSTILFEKNALGGVCLNEGCVPTKTLLYSAKTYDNIKHASKYAVKAENPSFDLPKIIARKNKVVKKLTAGIRMKMTEHGVVMVTAEACIQGRAADGTITIAAGEELYEAANLLICTGIVDIFGIDKEALDGALARIKAIVAIPEVGETYHGKVRSIVAFGAFVEIMPGKDALLHISEIDYKRFETMEETGLKEGDEIDVKLIGVDPKTNKLKLSRKALLPKPEGYVERERRPRPERGERGERRDRGERRERHEHKEE